MRNQGICDLAYSKYIHFQVLLLLVSGRVKGAFGENLTSSWWLNQPTWKVCASKFRVKNKKSLSCHHLDTKWITAFCRFWVFYDILRNIAYFSLIHQSSLEMFGISTVPTVQFQLVTTLSPTPCPHLVRSKSACHDEAWDETRTKQT